MLGSSMTYEPIPERNWRNKLHVKIFSISFFICFSKELKGKYHRCSDLHRTLLKIDLFPVSLRLYLNNACFILLDLL